MSRAGIALRSAPVPTRDSLSPLHLKVEAMMVEGKSRREMMARLEMKNHALAKYVERVRDVRAFELMKRTR